MRSFHASQGSASACACAFFAASSLMRQESPAFDAENDRGPEDDNEFVQELIRRMDHFAAARGIGPRPSLTPPPPDAA